MADIDTTIVFVHGLWLTGHESAWLRRDLSHRLSANAVTFAYRSVTQGMEQNAAELAEFLQTLSTPRLHLVGHSLGGLVILKYFAANPVLAPGRIVLLGSPLGGSRVAQGLAHYPLARMILGRGIEEEVIAPIERRWSGARDLGIIAGDLSFGLGRWFGQLSAANDGTVLVEETKIEGANDHIVLPVSHTGMLFAKGVAEQTAAFLSSGRFLREPYEAP